MKRDIDPGRSNIKRRFQDILKGDEYISVSGGPGSSESVSHKDYQKSMRNGAMAVTRDLMEQIATQSLLSTTTDTALCRDCFRQLNEMQEYQNSTPLRALVSVLVAVRISYAEEGLISPFQPLSPAGELEVKELSDAIDRALNRVLDNDIQKFITNRRISTDQGNRMVEACRNFLLDSCNGKGTDSLPHYFREFLPLLADEYHSSKFKYPFETVMNRALVYLREDSGNGLISRASGDY